MLQHRINEAVVVTTAGPLPGCYHMAASSLSDLEVRSEASGGSRLFFRSFEANSGSYLTKMIGKIDRFPAAAVKQPKSDRLLAPKYHRVNQINEQYQIRHCLPVVPQCPLLPFPYPAAWSWQRFRPLQILAACRPEKKSLSAHVKSST